MEFVKIIWEKKYFVLTFIFCCLVTTVFLDKIKAPVFKTEATLLIFSPYNPNNFSLPNAPYSSKLFNDLFHNKNMRDLVIDEINKKHLQANITTADLEDMVSIELSSHSNLIKFKIKGVSPEYLLDVANMMVESFIIYFNDIQEAEYKEMERIIDDEIGTLRKKLFDIEVEIENLQTNINLTTAQQKYNSENAQLISYKSQMRDKKRNIDGIDARIQELDSQLREEKENPPPSQGLINSLNSQLKTQYVVKEGLLAEYGEIAKIIDNFKREKDNPNRTAHLGKYKSQLRDKKINIDGIDARIQEFEGQLREEKEDPPPNQGQINSLKSQLKAQHVERKTKYAEYKNMEAVVVKLIEETDSLNLELAHIKKELAHHNRELKRLERERSFAENQLRSFRNKADQAKLEAKSKQIFAKIIEPSSKPQLVQSNLKLNLVWSGVGGLLFSIVILRLFFL